VRDATIARPPLWCNQSCSRARRATESGAPYLTRLFVGDVGNSRILPPKSLLMNKMSRAGFASSLVGPWLEVRAHSRSPGCARDDKGEGSGCPRNLFVGWREKQVPPLRYASVGMTNMFGGRTSTASALPVQEPWEIWGIRFRGTEKAKRISGPQPGNGKYGHRAGRWNKSR
jgi:hypothetical protein